MHEIIKGIYYEDAYCSGNVGLVLTDEGAMLIDSPMLPKEAWEWLRKVTSIAKKGIALLVNTDYKIERVLGNCFFPATVNIAHQLAWAELAPRLNAVNRAFLSTCCKAIYEKPVTIGSIKITCPTTIA